MSDRYRRRFASLAELGQPAFVPFLTIGDPTPDDTRAFADQLIESGADALELGLPFSDPLADGPTIQRSMARGLAAGVTPDDAFDWLAALRRAHPDLPLGLLVYANLVHARGIAAFYTDAAASGVDSVLVADVPLCEIEPFRRAALEADVDPVLLCPPEASDETLRQVAELGRGYTYLLSRSGVTGTGRSRFLWQEATQMGRSLSGDTSDTPICAEPTGTSTAAGRPLDSVVRTLERWNAPPPLLGFGISRPEHVRQAFAAGVRGVICGSAVMEIIERNLGDVAAARRELDAFVRPMKGLSAR